MSNCPDSRRTEASGSCACGGRNLTGRTQHQTGGLKGTSIIVTWFPNSFTWKGKYCRCAMHKQISRKWHKFAPTSLGLGWSFVTLTSLWGTNPFRFRPHVDQLASTHRRAGNNLHLVAKLGCVPHGCHDNGSILLRLGTFRWICDGKLTGTSWVWMWDNTNTQWVHGDNG